MDNSYIFSYTAATLMLHETHEVIKKYLEIRDWDKTKNQVKEALMDNEVKKYVDIEKVEGLLEKYDDISNCQNRNEVKLILIPLVFYKFIKQYREMLNFQYDI